MKEHPYYDSQSKKDSFKIAVWSGIGLVVLLIIIFASSALNLIELQ
jgi:hypothetical protein